jgi:hypothetical protein
MKNSGNHTRSQESENKMKPRLVIFSLDLGLSFAILVLYISSIEVISLVVLLITASVVAASKEDLTDLRANRNFVFIIILSAIASFLLAAYFSTPYNGILFYGLFALNICLLSAYAVMRRLDSHRGQSEYDFRKQDR